MTHVKFDFILNSLALRLLEFEDQYQLNFIQTPLTLWVHKDDGVKILCNQPPPKVLLNLRSELSIGENGLNF